MIERGTIDWRFCLALAFAVMVTYLGYAGWVGIEESKEKDVRIDDLIEVVQERDDVIRDRDHVIELERRAAAKERRRLLRNQRLLVDYTRSLDQRQGALLAYLQRHGIEIPPRFVTRQDPPAIRDTEPPTRSPKNNAPANPPPSNPGGSAGRGGPPGGSNPPGNGNGHGPPDNPGGGHGNGPPPGKGPKALADQVVEQVAAVEEEVEDLADTDIPDVPEAPDLPGDVVTVIGR